MYRLKKIDIQSVALYSFIMLLILGFIFMIPFGLLTYITSSLSSGMPTSQSGLPMFFSGIFLILFPVLYAVFGTIINVIIVFIYNIMSYKFGGIIIKLNKINVIPNVNTNTSYSNEAG